MSVTLADPLTELPAAARAELTRAVDRLEHASLAAQLASLAGQPIEVLKARLPTVLQNGLDAAVRRALSAAMEAALKTDPARTPIPVASAWFHRGMAAASGAAGGAFGLPGTLVELPVSTTLLLRQVAAVAAENGEDLSQPDAAAECLKVFALGGRDARDDATETGYFAVRIALAEALKGAATRGLMGFAIPGFLGAVAARFGGPVALKVSAQAVPLLGAAAGAAVNLAFLEHFRGIAQAHFTVRRLERAYGAPLVKRAYQELAAKHDARFNG
jgi:hypothetical protein